MDLCGKVVEDVRRGALKREGLGEGRFTDGGNRKNPVSRHCGKVGALGVLLDARGEGGEVVREDQIAHVGALFRLLVLGEETLQGLAAFLQQLQDRAFETGRVQETLERGTEGGERGQVRLEEGGEGSRREGGPRAGGGFEHRRRHALLGRGEAGHLVHFHVARGLDQEVGAGREAFLVEEGQALDQL